ncbi:TetR/AcrR family transcriptional regulator [Bacteroides thetaiotaomicron]|uniref:TetR/AcrR family transcriptional regulator n=1 Tax=Bacteroides thetaiotaomicron TaxID=818 RepID=UPI0039C47CB7
MKKSVKKTKRGKNSRDLILKEAFKLFLQKNVEKVTVPDLEKATGVQRGAIFYHFKDKEALFVEVIDQYFFFRVKYFLSIKSR